VTIVLDASAVIDVLFGQPDKAWVLRQITDQEIVAPSHQPAEVLSAVDGLVRSGQSSRRSAHRALDEYAELHQTLRPPSADDLRRSLDIDGRLRVLDALYVVLAADLACPLVTTDRRLARANPPCEIAAPGRQ